MLLEKIRVFMSKNSNIAISWAGNKDANIETALNVLEAYVQSNTTRKECLAISKRLLRLLYVIGMKRNK